MIFSSAPTSCSPPHRSFRQLRHSLNPEATMDIFNLILLCSVVSSAPHQTLLYQIAQTADQSSTYVDDLTAAKVYDPPRRREATQITRALIESGHELRVGLTQVPAHQARRRYHATSRRLVQACSNISYGSQHLRRARRRYPDDNVNALAFYFTGSADDPLGRAWAHHVLENRDVDVEHAATHPAAAPPSPQYSVPQNRLFVDKPQLTRDGDSQPNPRRAKTVFSDRSSSRTTESSEADDDLAPISKFPPPEDVDRTSPSHAEGSDTSVRRNHTDSPADKPSFRKLIDKRSMQQRAQTPVTDERLPTSESTNAGRDAGQSQRDERPADNSRQTATPDPDSEKDTR